MRQLLKVLLIPVIAYASAMGYLWYEVKSDVDKTIKQAAHLARIKYDSIFISPLGDEVRVNNIVIEPVTTHDRLKIEEFSFTGPHPGYLLIAESKKNKGIPPENISMQIHRMELDIDSELISMLDDSSRRIDGEPLQISLYLGLDAIGCGKQGIFTLDDYRSMGIDKLTTDVGLATKYNQIDNRFSITVIADFENLYSMETHLDYAISPEDIATPREFMTGAWQKMTIKEHDTGYHKLRNAYCAKRNNGSVNTYISRHVELIEKAKGISLPDKPLKAYKDLMLNGGNLTASLNPMNTITFEDLKYYKDTDVIDILGLKISFNGTELDLKSLFQNASPEKTVTPETVNAQPNSLPFIRPQPTKRNSPTLSTKAPSQASPQVIRLSDAGKYLNRNIEIKMSDGRVRSGVLEKVAGDRLYLVMKLRSGTFTYPVKMDNIDSIKVGK